MTLPGFTPHDGDGERAGTLTDALAGEIELVGKPMTMARARFSRSGPTYTPEDRVLRMGDFAQAWADEGQPRFAKGIYLAAEFEFVFARPSSHFGSGRNSEILRPSAPKFPGRGQYGGDLDNLVKLVCDGLSKVAFNDDSQIVSSTEIKRWALRDELPHTRVRLQPV